MSDLPSPATPGSSPVVGNPQVSPHAVPTGGLHKEQEPLGTIDTNDLEEVSQELKLSPELEQAGVVNRSDTIELPPDIRKMGVTASGPSQPVGIATSVTLPLSDDQIVVGLHAQIVSSIRWLAEWCVKRLKKAHVHLKQLGGKVVRENG